jgi:mono/diheme cytochrome c family protein
VFFNGLPAQIKVDERLLKRGRERFDIYCASCHGADGLGNGAVNSRAEGVHSKWVRPSDLTSALVRGRADGHVFNTITNGIRNMPGYGAQIPVEDRWAIVAYVRALQELKPAKGGGK